MDTTFVGFPIVSVQLKIAAKLPYLEKISSIFQVIVIHADFTKKKSPVINFKNLLYSA